MADEKQLVENLFSDDSFSDLSEDFKSKVTVLFEDAVANKVAEEKQSLKESYETKLNEETEQMEKDMEEKIDSYLTYVAEEWVKENELAIENGIQVEIAENFLKGMKTLFEESYVEIPDDKVDIVQEMVEDIDKKTKALDEAMDDNIRLQKELTEMKKSSIVSKYSNDLASTQMDKLNDLVEMIEYEDDEQFSERVSNIVETYFKKNINEKEDEEESKDDKKKMKGKKEEDEVEVEESYAKYIEAISEAI